jgi:hypothetical protein
MLNRFHVRLLAVVSIVGCIPSFESVRGVPSSVDGAVMDATATDSVPLETAPPKLDASIDGDAADSTVDDADSGAGFSCATLVPGRLFCDDFEEPRPALPDRLDFNVTPEGSVTLEYTVVRTGSAALKAALGPHDNPTDSARARGYQSFSPKYDAALEFDMRFDIGVGRTNEQIVALLGTIDKESVYLAKSQQGLRIVEQFSDAAGNFGYASGDYLAPPVGWFHARIEVSLSKRSIVLTVDGTSLARVLSGPNWDKSPLTETLVGLSASTLADIETTVYVDNVAVFSL